MTRVYCISSQHISKFIFTCSSLKSKRALNIYSIERLLSTNGDKRNHKRKKNQLRLVTFLTKFIGKYEMFLERRFPRVFTVYKTFRTGFMEFISDLNTYRRVLTGLMMNDDWSSFTYRELDVYRQTPTDLVKFSPTLVASLLPFTIYAVLPIAYKYPTVLLSRHFWTETDNRAYMLKRLNKGVQSYPSVLRHLYRHGNIMTNNIAPLNLVLDKVTRNEPISTEHVLSLIDLFSSSKFQYSCFSSAYKVALARSHQVSWPFFQKHMMLLHQTNLALIREQLSSLDDPKLEMACFVRGLNPVGLSRQERESFLEQWLTISSSIDQASMSLLMHCNVFFAYNHGATNIILKV